MPFQIVRNDITAMRVDAIVNTANPKPLIGFGVDSGIHKKAGPQLLAARKAIGKLTPGQCAMTPGFQLAAKYVVHTCAPVWHGGNRDEAALLQACYRGSLELAWKAGCGSIAFPLIAAGNNGFPKPMALQIALDTIQEFLLSREMDVYLVVFDRDAFRLSEQRFQGIRSYIDEQTVIRKNMEEYGVSAGRSPEQAAMARTQNLREATRSAPEEACPGPKEACRSPKTARPSPKRTFPAPPADAAPMAIPRPWAPDPIPHSAAPRVGATMPVAAPHPMKLEDMLLQEDKGFSETLLALIDRTGKKDSEIYTKANVSRQHFSKIRNNPGYKPTKATAIAFAVALELDMEKTQDLIGRAGYALTRSSKFDLIIMYFIQTRNYDMFEINAALFEFDQVLLGA